MYFVMAIWTDKRWFYQRNYLHNDVNVERVQLFNNQYFVKQVKFNFLNMSKLEKVQFR